MKRVGTRFGLTFPDVSYDDQIRMEELADKQPLGALRARGITGTSLAGDTWSMTLSERPSFRKPWPHPDSPNFLSSANSFVTHMNTMISEDLLQLWLREGTPVWEIISRGERLAGDNYKVPSTTITSPHFCRSASSSFLTSSSSLLPPSAWCAVGTWPPSDSARRWSPPLPCRMSLWSVLRSLP
jgi:hypothetical protein